MKQILYALAVILTFTACSKEDDLSSSLILDDHFEIKDDPNDPVQHERYKIYKDFNVPVYFNDTISRKQIGTDWYGNPVMRYETVDLNWTFDSYEQNIKYKYKYLTTSEDQLNTLKFARKYLETCSPAMRPFSILLVDLLQIISDSETNEPNYHIGFRTLVFAQIKDITDEDEIIEHAQTVIQNMLISKVTANKNLCARFKNVSAEKGWYDKMWSDLGSTESCPTILRWNGTPESLGFRINNLYYGVPYNAVQGTKPDFIDHCLDRGILPKEEAELEREKMVREMGNYGFICSSTRGSIFTPEAETEDLSHYIKAMLYLGTEQFVDRYGDSPLVMQKYSMLYEYIVNELKVEL